MVALINSIEELSFQDSKVCDVFVCALFFLLHTLFSDFPAFVSKSVKLPFLMDARSQTSVRFHKL